MSNFLDILATVIFIIGASVVIGGTAGAVCVGIFLALSAAAADYGWGQTLGVTGVVAFVLLFAWACGRIEKAA